LQVFFGSWGAKKYGFLVLLCKHKEHHFCEAFFKKAFEKAFGVVGAGKRSLPRTVLVNINT
jgi:hypothetical protein